MRRDIPNLLVICGSGRNIGKTALLCSVIHHTKDKFEIAAIKISPNFHPEIQSEDLIWKEKDLNIYIEKEISKKDSSLFLQAGADPVYYVETTDEQLLNAFNKIFELIGKEKLIVCESGLLARFVKPGVLVYIESTKKITENNKLLKNRQIADLNLNADEGSLTEKQVQINKQIVASPGKWELVVGK